MQGNGSGSMWSQPSDGVVAEAADCEEELVLLVLQVVELEVGVDAEDEVVDVLLAGAGEGRSRGAAWPRAALVGCLSLLNVPGDGGGELVHTAQELIEVVRHGS
mgnify:CR=1 FL=1